MKAISKLKNKKSSGLDGSKNEMLKTGQTYLVPCIVKLFNTILSSGTYPTDWKIGYIKPIYKGDDPIKPSNYRGISIMPCLSKVFNSVLNNRLQTFFDINNTIDQSQIGFQPKTRTADHMFVLRTLIEKYQSKNSKLYACFVDFAKAFDSIIHSVMFYKLTQIGICGPFYNTLKTMYEANCIHVKVEDKLTKGQMAFIVLDQLEDIPYALVFKTQYCVMYMDCPYIGGLIESIENNKHASEQLMNYFHKEKK